MMKGQLLAEDPGIMAEFATETELQLAVVRLEALGYIGIEIYSPYPVLGMTGLMREQRPILTWIVFYLAMAGAGLAFFTQWYTNAENFPINVGGRPLFALPVWVPVIFEIGVLTVGFGALFTFLWACGLPRLWFPTFEVAGFENVTVDGFWLAIDRRDTHFDPVTSRFDLEGLDPLRIELVELTEDEVAG